MSATFGNHPDPSTDFCLEIERLEGLAADVECGLRSQWPFWSRLSRLLAFNRSPIADALDEIAQRVRPVVGTLESRLAPDDFVARATALCIRIGKYHMVCKKGIFGCEDGAFETCDCDRQLDPHAYQAILEALVATPSPSCTTCRDDPDVCVTVPMRHCAKATAEADALTPPTQEPHQ